MLEAKSQGRHSVMPDAELCHAFLHVFIHISHSGGILCTAQQSTH